MVRDGIYFALGLGVAAIVLGWLAGPGFTLIPIPFAAFFLWFFRDPERIVPTAPGSIVSPADGKVTAAGLVEVKGIRWQRISIFLNVFDVHVNRSPIAGVIREIEYRRGKFGNAMGAVSAESNEQNVVTVEGEGMTVIFKQIAGLLARRIVFTPKPGDYLYRGQRVGMIKFGSRVDVLLPPDAVLQVRLGDHVAGGSTVIAMGAKNVVPEMALASQISQAPVAGGMI